MDITFTIPNEKVAEYISDYIYIHQNDQVDGDGEPLYTNGEWVKQHILEYIRSQIIRGKIKKLKDAEEILNVDDVV